jgi:hypothetical protein
LTLDSNEAFMPSKLYDGFVMVNAYYSVTVLTHERSKRPLTGA